MDIASAARIIRDGGVVAFPTETVYGLGANALNAEAVGRVFALKGRPSTSPLIVHVDSVEMAREIVAEWPERAEQWARRYWPGPLTLVLPKKPCVPDVVTAGLPTVGVRMPAHPIALALIGSAEVPIAAPSANRFTQLSPTTAEHVRNAFGDEVPVIDGGATDVGIESTVISLVGPEPVLLRPGLIQIPGCTAAPVAPAGEAHPAPGMHERHYSPRTPLFLVEQGVLPSEGRGVYLFYDRRCDCARSIGMPSDPRSYAAVLYMTLHEIDGRGFDWIAVERPPRKPEWAGINDRLERAAR